jgi:hypothetical protein
MISYITEYGKLVIMEFKLLKWQKLYEEIETTYRYNARIALKNKQVSTKTFEYEPIIETLSDLVVKSYDFLLANKDYENRIYKIVKNFSNILIKNQKNNYAHNINEIENIMTNLGYFVDNLDELYEEIKTNYNNAFMGLSKDEQKKYKDVLPALMMIKSTEIMLELHYTKDEAISVINNVSSKIFEYTDNLLNIVNE